MPEEDWEDVVPWLHEISKLSCQELHHSQKKRES